MTAQPQIDKPKIFISHAGKDRDLTRRVVNELKAVGAEEPWVDYDKIHAGDILRREINKALAWCDILVLLWSEAASHSEYVEEEWMAAAEFKKTIITCLFDDTPLPTTLAIRKYISFKYIEKGIEELIQQIGFTRKSPEAQENKELASHSPLTLTTKPIQLRSQPVIDLSKDDVNKMIKEKDFFHQAWNTFGRGLQHHYEVIESNKIKMVIAHTTNLMWQQCPTSIESVKFDKIDSHIQKQNLTKRGGYDGWRLPTLEEAMSLMEETRSTEYKFYIDPIFKVRDNQISVWTLDKMSFNEIWIAHFTYGEAILDTIENGWNHILAVRTIS